MQNIPEFMTSAIAPGRGRFPQVQAEVYEERAWEAKQRWKSLERAAKAAREAVDNPPAPAPEEPLAEWERELLRL